MDLRTEVGELLIALPTDAMPLARFVDETPVGGFLLPNETRGTARVLASAVAAAQERATLRTGLPLLIAADQEGGDMTFLPDEVTPIPSAMGLAATADPTAAREAAEIIATDLVALGVNWNFAPVVDVNTDPRNPVIGARAFADDPAVVAAFAAESISGHQRHGVLACAKHFPGHGDTHVDSHVALPVVAHDRARIEGVDLVPFAAAVSAGVESVMTGHLLVPSLDPVRPATLSQPIIGGLLRDRLGFDGLVVTDAMPMGAISASWDEGEAAIEAIVAGADVVLGGRGLARHKRVHRAVFEAVRGGRIGAERFRTALARVRAAKQRIDVGAADGRVGGSADRRRALSLARRGVTVLRDDDGLLPLSRGLGKRLLVITPNGSRATKMEQWHARPSPLGALVTERVPGATEIPVSYPPSRSEISAILRQARHAQVVVVGTLNAAHDESQLALVRRIAAETDARVVAITLRAPYDALHLDSASAVLCAYSGVLPAVQAAVEVLVGERLAAGRPPVALPFAYQLPAHARRTSA